MHHNLRSDMQSILIVYVYAGCSDININTEDNMHAVYLPVE